MANGPLFGVLQSLLQRFQLQPANSHTDRVLLERFLASRDESAFEALMQRHGPMVLGVCRGILRDHHQAEDAFQATYLVLARNASSVQRSESLGAWLHRVACRLAWRARISRAHRQLHEKQVPAMAESKSTSALENQEAFGLLHEEINHLPDKYRRLVVRCDLQGTSHALLAEELGVSRVTVTERLGQARARLRRRLQARGLTTATALVGGSLVEQASASLPHDLATSTLQSALAFAQGQYVEAVAPAGVALLVNGYLSGLIVYRLVLAMAVLLALGVLAGGTGLWLRQPPSAQNLLAAGPPAAVAPAAEVNKKRTDLFGDVLPEGALYRLGTIRLSHGEPVEQMAYVPGQRMLATSARDGSLRLWDLDTGTEVRRFPYLDSSQFRASFFAFSSDGKTLAVNRQDHLALIEAATGKEIGRCDGPSCHFTFTPDGRTLLAVYQNCVRHWDVASCRKLREWSHDKDDANYFYKCAFSPDCRLLAVGDFDQKKPIIHLWDVTLGKQIHEWEAHQDYIWSVAFTPDGKSLVSTSFDETIGIWHGDSGAEKERWQKIKKTPYLAFAPNGKLLALPLVGELRLYAWPSGKEVSKIQGTEGPVAFSSDGQTVAAVRDRQVRFWDTATGKEKNPLPTHPRKITDIKYAPKGGLAVSKADGRLMVCQVTTGKDVGSLPGENVLSFLPDGKTAVTLLGSGAGPEREKDATVYYAGLATGKVIAQFRVPAEPHEILTVSPDGRTVALTDVACQKLRFWDLATGKEVRSFEGKCVTYSADFQKVAIVTERWGGVTTAIFDDPNPQPTCGGKIEVRSVATDKVLSRIADYAPAIASVTFDENGSRTSSVTHHAPTFSPDGQTLLAAGDSGRRVRVWDIATDKELPAPGTGDVAHGRLLAHMQEWGHSRKTKLQRWETSPDGRLTVAAYTNGTLVLWEAATGEQIRSWNGYQGSVENWTFAPNGRTLSTLFSDGTALVWDVTGQLTDGELPRLVPSAEELVRYGNELASLDASRAHRAQWSLIAAGNQVIPFLQDRLPKLDIQSATIARLVAELDSNHFEVREKARQQLVKMEGAASLLRRTLARNPSLELRQRIEALLAELDDPAADPVRLQSLRCLAVLEGIGTPEAREVLATIAKGDPTFRRTRDARSALTRLAKDR